MRQLKLAIAGVFALTLLGACASTGGGPGEVEIRTGVIQRITLTEVKQSHDQGVGASTGLPARVSAA